MGNCMGNCWRTDGELMGNCSFSSPAQNFSHNPVDVRNQRMRCIARSPWCKKNRRSSETFSELTFSDLSSGVKELSKDSEDSRSASDSSWARSGCCHTGEHTDPTHCARRQKVMLVNVLMPVR